MNKVLGVSALLLLFTNIAALTLLQDWEIGSFLTFFVLQSVICAFAGWWNWRSPRQSPVAERRLLIAILGVAALLRCLALFAPQALSTDVYRYVWDGRVQAAHINPYRYIPADPALKALRDSTIYPGINRADYAHTIYPPSAQLAFLAIERISDSVIAMKLGMVAFEALSITCLIALLRSRGLPASRVLAYAWHPLPIWELAGTGHIDAMATALILLTFWMASRRAPLATGVALAAATLVKFYPIVCAPALYRRWDWRMPIAFLITCILLYLPYLGVGAAVLGYLPGYAAEEGLSGGSGIFLWSLLQHLFTVPEQGLRYVAPFALTVLAALSLWLQFGAGSRTRDPICASMLLAAVFTLLISPHDPWYFTWLVPFLCFRFSWPIAWLTVGCTLMYVLPDPTRLSTQAWIYGPFLVLALLQLIFNRRSSTQETFDANTLDRRLST